MSTPIDQNPFAPPTARVDDVSPGGLELGGRGTRLAAVIIDGLIQGGIYYALALTIFRTLLPSPQTGLSGVNIIMQFVISIVILLIVQGYLLATQGQTIGKKLLGLRIVRSDGTPVAIGRLLGLRYLLVWALAVIPVVGWIFALVDALMIFRDSRKCLHDTIADTIVIKA